MQIKNNELLFGGGQIPLEVKPMASEQSANSILTSGIFRGNFTDTPIENTLSWILSINMASETDSRYLIQFFGVFNSDVLYFRRRNDGYWQNWKTISIT